MTEGNLIEDDANELDALNEYLDGDDGFNQFGAQSGCGKASGPRR